MKIKAEQLEQHLSKGVKPAYLITGDEPLLVQEACDQIRAAYRSAGFEERELYHGEKGDLEAFAQAGDSMSLFANLTLHEFRFTDKLKKEHGDTFADWAERNIDDQRLLISAPKLDASTTKTAWYKRLEPHIVEVVIWPVAENQLLGWLKQRARKLNLNLSDNILKAVEERVQGNLLAGSQELERLALIYETDSDEQSLIDSIADNARFDVYKLMDQCLFGQTDKVIRMLRALELEGESPARIGWLISNELTKIAQMAWRYHQGANMEQIFGQYRIWSSKKGVYRAALDRHSVFVWQRLLARSLKLDKLIKGQEKGDPWLECRELILLIAGKALWHKAG